MPIGQAFGRGDRRPEISGWLKAGMESFRTINEDEIFLLRKPEEEAQVSRHYAAHRATLVPAPDRANG